MSLSTIQIMRDIRDKRRTQKANSNQRAPEDELLRRAINLQNRRKRQSSVAMDSQYDYQIQANGDEEKSQASSPDAQLHKMQMLQERLAGKKFSKVGMNALNNNYMGKDSMASPRYEHNAAPRNSNPLKFRSVQQQMKLQSRSTFGSPVSKTTSVRFSPAHDRAMTTKNARQL